MKIAFFGDTAFFDDKDISNYNYKEYYSEVKKLINECDYIVVNLESPLCDKLGKPTIKSANIYSKSRNIEVLKYLGVNIVNLANNHILDYGEESLKETIKHLKENNIDYFGIYDKNILLPENVKLSGLNCYSTNGVGYTKIVNTLTKDSFNDCIKNEDKINICSVHMGEEHVHIPNIAHMKLFRSYLSKYNNNIIIGHHPHVIQGFEKIKSNYIFYSLGNFIFSDVYKDGKKFIKRNEDNREGLCLIVNISNNQITSIENYLMYDNDNKILIKNHQDTTIKIQEYNMYLQENYAKLISLRKKMLDNYIKNRKKSRTLSWYLNRLNSKYFRLFFLNKKNQKQFKKNMEDIC